MERRLAERAWKKGQTTKIASGGIPFVVGFRQREFRKIGRAIHQKGKRW